MDNCKYIGVHINTNMSLPLFNIVVTKLPIELYIHVPISICVAIYPQNFILCNPIKQSKGNGIENRSAAKKP